MKKLQEDNCVAKGFFFGCSEEWYHFQQELMVNKMIVKLFINSTTNQMHALSLRESHSSGL